MLDAEEQPHRRPVTIRRLAKLIEDALAGELEEREAIAMLALLLAARDMAELEDMCERAWEEDAEV